MVCDLAEDYFPGIFSWDAAGEEAIVFGVGVANVGPDGEFDGLGIKLFAEGRTAYAA